MAVGIICEYNPFHNGHIYHIKKTKELFKDEEIILVLSGHFLERGEISLLNKWDKTSIALKYGVDLVVELPFIYASQSADIFAKGAINILNNLNVNYLVFGSESNDIKVLEKVAEAQFNKEFDTLIKKYLDECNNYPTALSKAIFDLTNITISSPNDLLGISYIKEIKRINSNIKPICIQRTNDYHSNKLTDIISASNIRNLLKEKKDISKFVPLETLNCLYEINDYFKLLKYKIITEPDLSIYQTVDKDMHYRLKKYINDCNSIDELTSLIKNKKYTYNKINRMYIHILTSFNKMESKNIEYIRVLGFNNTGKSYLNKIKKQINIPIITTYNKCLDQELKVTSIYSLLINDPSIITKEYKNKPIH